MKNILITSKVKKDKFKQIIYSIEKNWYEFFKSKKINIISLNRIHNQKKYQNIKISGVVIHGGNDLPSIKKK